MFVYTHQIHETRKYTTRRAEHSVGSVQNRTEPKGPKTEVLKFSGPDRTEVCIWTEPEPNRNNSVGPVRSARTEFFKKIKLIYIYKEN